MAPRGLIVIASKHCAWVSKKHDQWDAIWGHNIAPDEIRATFSKVADWRDVDLELDEEGVFCQQFWNEYVDRTEQAVLKVARRISFERIVAIDPVGDGIHPIPHIFVEFDSQFGPYTEAQNMWLESTDPARRPIVITPSDANRFRYFPDPLPPTIYPPPPGFFHEASTDRCRISAGAEERLRLLLNLEQSVVENDVGQGHAQVETELCRDVSEFRQWRDRIALPVFGEMARQIRSCGLETRIVVLEDSLGGAWRREPELVELRVEPRVADAEHRPLDWTPGSIKYCLSMNGRDVRCITSPPNYSSHQGNPRTVDSIGERSVEEETLAMLERHLRGY